MKFSISTLAAFLISLSSFATIAPITGVVSVCVGSHNLLSDATAGGAWSSSNASIADVDTTGSFLGIGAGTATITYTVAGSYVVIEVTVNSLPQIYGVTGGGTFCSGGEGVPVGVNGSDPDDIYVLYLTGSTVGVGPASVGTGSPLNLASPTVAGTYLVYAVNAAGCASDMAGNAIIVVQPSPSPIIGNAVVCTGTNTTLTDTTSGGVWSSFIPSLATIDGSGIVTGVATGAATISYTLPTGCATAKLISVEPMSVPSITYSQATITFYATPGYVSYQWYDSIQGEIPGATSPTLAAFDSGYYYVVVTNSYGCKRASALYDFSLEELGVNSISNNSEFTIYPNPAQNELTISSPGKVRSVMIINSLGDIVFSQQYNSENVHANIGGLPAGDYFVRINDSQVRQFVKQ